MNIFDQVGSAFASDFVSGPTVNPQYQPPKRPWVGLTHEDIDKAIEDNQRFGGFRKVGFAYDLENVLKEKNNGT